MKFLKSKIFIMFVYCLLTICIAFSGSFLVENFTKFVASAVGSDITEDIQGGGGSGQPTETDFALPIESKDAPVYQKSTLEIFGKAGMENFSESVRYGLDFKGKRIVLQNDINYNKGEFCPIGRSGPSYQGFYDEHYFRGTFDGQGHTISNMKTKITSVTNTPNSYILVGFIGSSLGATIQNLRIKNYTIDASDETVMNQVLYCGGLVGYSYDTTISQCSVENLTINLQSTSTVYHGAFVGSLDYLGYGSNILIQNCYLKDYKVNCQYGECCYSLIGIADDSSTVNIQHFVDYGGEEVIVNNDKILNNQGSNVVDYIKSANTKPTPQTPEESDPCNSVGGKDSKTPWYYVLDYNGGWPYLRKFISWKELNIKAQDETDIKFKIDDIDNTNDNTNPSISIPSDYNVSLTETDKKKRSIIVCGRKIEAVDGDAYTFTSWSYSKGTLNDTLTANASIKLVKLTFINNDNCEFRGNNEYTIQSGEKIQITFEDYDRQGCHKSITIKFKNSNNEDIVITYIISNEKFYISELSISPQDTSQTITENTSQTITKDTPQTITKDTLQEINADSEFSVNCGEKTYTIKFE